MSASPDRMKDLLEEALGGDFEVVKLIGSGSRADVYLAREIPLDRLVAVKVLLSGLAEDDVARARFGREAKAAASLNHPNVASVFRSGFLSNGVPFLILQYVRGRTLAQRLSAEGPVPAAEARRILRDIAAALGSAHEQGFVHRDVKPGNVMSDLETGRTLLTDFGVAGIIPTGKDQGPRLTQVGEHLGDLMHLSPEELMGEDATGASDIYSLGVLGYEILTGRGPFPDLPASAMVASHLRAPPQPLSSLLEESEPDLESILERCLSKDAADRPSADFVAEALGPKHGGSTSLRGTDASTGDESYVASLMRRRFPQIVVVTAGGGWIVLEVVTQLFENQLLGPLWYPLALATYVCGVAASAVVAWFHGEKGKQKTGLIEIALLAVMAVAWILICVRILLPAGAS